MKKSLAILLIAAAAAVLSSCGYMYTPSSSKASSAASSSAASKAASSLAPESSEEPKEPEYLAVGDACIVGDWEITISSVAVQERVDTSTTLYYEADEGNQYIVSVAPLSTASGVLVFSVPDAVATSSDPLILRIDEGLLKSAKYQIK